MTEKGKKVTVTENSLVNLIYDIVERTINERVEKGELVKPKPTIHPELSKTKKIKVTESQLKALKANGVEIKSVSKITG
jgi:hypothetical protein